MATIQHFTHPGHQLAEFNAERNYICDGCKTPGAGKRYRCHGCDFDLHEYCATCPKSLSSFMHHHKLSLLMRNPQGNLHKCDICRDSIEGLFYRCEDCDFDVHPLCTQLPEALRHVLHQPHPLRLEASLISSSCAVCGGVCHSWRYRCGGCGFDIHLECVVVVCERTKQRGTLNFGPPPSFWRPQPPPPPSYYAFGPPPHGGYPHGFSYSPRPYNWVQQNQSVGAKPGGLGTEMFTLVGQLGFGVVSNVIFGMDFYSLFSS